MIWHCFWRNKKEDNFRLSHPQLWDSLILQKKLGLIDSKIIRIFFKTLHHPWFQSFVSVKKIFMLRRLEILKRLLAKTSLTKTKTLTKLLQVLCPLPQKLWGRPRRGKWMEKAVVCLKERGQPALIAEWDQPLLRDHHHYTVIRFHEVFFSKKTLAKLRS